MSDENVVYTPNKTISAMKKNEIGKEMDKATKQYSECDNPDTNILSRT